MIQCKFSNDHDADCATTVVWQVRRVITLRQLSLGPSLIRYAMCNIVLFNFVIDSMVPIRCCFNHCQDVCLLCRTSFGMEESFLLLLDLRF